MSQNRAKREEKLRQSNALKRETYFALDELGRAGRLARTAGIALLVLIAANARWDREGRLEGCLEEYLSHVADEKPITARQCIQNLPEIARAQPRLAARIAGRLKQADPSRYQDSMAPLIAKDIAAALRKIEAMLQS